jgi:hypothetical protein
LWAIEWCKIEFLEGYNMVKMEPAGPKPWGFKEIEQNQGLGTLDTLETGRRSARLSRLARLYITPHGDFILK